MSETDKSELTVRELIELLQRGTARNLDSIVKVVVHNPGTVGGSPAINLRHAAFGFDWDSGKFLLYPVQHLTALTAEQVNEITDSVRIGQSWHAGQNERRNREQKKLVEQELRQALSQLASAESILSEIRASGCLSPELAAKVDALSKSD